MASSSLFDGLFDVRIMLLGALLQSFISTLFLQLCATILIINDIIVSLQQQTNRTDTSSPMQLVILEMDIARVLAIQCFNTLGKLDST